MSFAKSNAASYVDQFTSQTVKGLDNYINELDKLTILPFSNEKVMKILENYKERDSAPEYILTKERQEASMFLSSLAFHRMDVKGALLLANDGTVFIYNFESNFSGESRMFWDEYKYNDSGETYIVPPHVPDYYNENELVFSIVRPIQKLYSEEVLGLIT